MKWTLSERREEGKVDWKPFLLLLAPLLWVVIDVVVVGIGRMVALREWQTINWKLGKEVSVLWAWPTLPQRPRPTPKSRLILNGNGSDGTALKCVNFY